MITLGPRSFGQRHGLVLLLVHISASAGTLWPELGPRWDQDLTLAKWKLFMSGSCVAHEWFMSGQ